MLNVGITDRARFSVGRKMTWDDCEEAFKIFGLGLVLSPSVT